MTALQTFAAKAAGIIVLPDDPGWNEARQAWNRSVDQHPAAVALPKSDEDVAHVVDVAREQGLRVAAQGAPATTLGRSAH